MKHFTHLTFDVGRCLKEAGQLQKFLATHKDLKEREHIQPFFEKRRHLSAFIAAYNPNIVHFDLLAYQYPLFGDFSCDVVVGDSVKHSFTFIEFEDAGPRSLFVRQGKKTTREWSPRFDHGYSQIIDWFYKLHDMERSADYEARFGAPSISFTGVLVLGRDQYLLPREKDRLDWRRRNVAVHSQTIQCVTFDGLLEDVLGRLKTFTLAARAGG